MPYLISFACAGFIAACVGLTVMFLASVARCRRGEDLGAFVFLGGCSVALVAAVAVTSLRVLSFTTDVTGLYRFVVSLF